jgi:hypothetical protein
VIPSFALARRGGRPQYALPAISLTTIATAIADWQIPAAPLGETTPEIQFSARPGGRRRFILGSSRISGGSERKHDGHQVRISPIDSRLVSSVLPANGELLIPHATLRCLQSAALL